MAEKSKASLSKTSRKLAQILRHKPGLAGLEESRDAFYPVGKILEALKVDMPMLEEIVSSDNKGRYSFNENKTLIRANQGHSYYVDPSLLLTPYSPEDTEGYLFHGTVSSSLEGIFKEGLLPRKRQFCHLTENRELAEKGARRWTSKGDRSTPVVLKISKKGLLERLESIGSQPYISENKVILVEKVDPDLIEVEYLS